MMSAALLAPAAITHAQGPPEGEAFFVEGRVMAGRFLWFKIGK